MKHLRCDYVLIADGVWPGVCAHVQYGSGVDDD